MSHSSSKPNEVEVPNVPEPLREAVAVGRCVLFAGAGFSVDAGAPTWRGLFEPLVDNELLASHGVSPEYIEGLKRLLADAKYLDLAGALKNKLSSFVIREHLRKTLTGLNHSSLHEAAVRIGFRGIVTTNYDTLFEQAYQAVHGTLPRVCDHREATDIADLARAKEFFVFKLHGTIDRASTVILDRQDYREMMHRNAPAREFFRQILATDTVLFAGYGLGDPDILLWIGGFLSDFGSGTARNYILTSTTNLPEQDAFLNNHNIQPLVYGVERDETGRERHAGLLRFLEGLAKKGEARALSSTGSSSRMPPISEMTDDAIRRTYLQNVAKNFEIQQNIGLGGGRERRAVHICIAKALVTPTVVREIASFLGEDEAKERLERDKRAHEKGKEKPSQKGELTRAEDRADEGDPGRCGVIRVRTKIANAVPVPVFLQDSRESVLLGSPGSGKSFLCRVLTLLLAVDDETKIEMREIDRWRALRSFLADYTPFHYPLRRAVRGERDTKDNELRFGSGSIPEIVAAWCAVDHLIPAGCSRQRFIRFIEKVAADGRGFFIFDGLDEAGERIGRSAITDKIAGYFRTATVGRGSANRLLLTSRVVGYEETPYPGPHEVATLAPFREEEIERFFLNWPYAVVGTSSPERVGKQRWEDFRKKALKHPKIFDMATSPILLTVITTVQERGATLPEQRVTLYSEASKVLFETWEHARAVMCGIELERFNYPREVTKRILGRLALEMTRRSVTSIDRGELTARLVEILSEEERGSFGETSIDGFLDEVRRQAPVLVEHGTELVNGRSVDSYSFVHKTFQEYLSAVAVLGTLNAEQWIKDNAHDAARFEEIIALMVGEAALNQNDSARAGALISSILRAEGYPREAARLEFLKMAARCLGEGLPLGKFENHLVELEWRQFRRGWLEPMSGHEPILCEMILSDGCRKRLRNRLERALRTSEKAYGVCKALSGVAEDPSVGKRLLEGLKCDNAGYRSNAARALSSVVTRADVTAALLNALKDNYRDVRNSAATALASVASQPEVTAALLNAFKDNDSDVRNSAAAALASVASQPEVTAALLNALKDNYRYVRNSAAKALASVASQPEVTAALLNALKDNYRDVRNSAAAALASVASQPEVTAALLNAFKDQEWQVRNSAAAALASVASQPEVTAALLNALKDNYRDVRGAAARALASSAAALENREEIRRTIHAQSERSTEALILCLYLSLRDFPSHQNARAELFSCCDDPAMTQRFLPFGGGLSGSLATAALEGMKTRLTIAPFPRLSRETVCSGTLPHEFSNYFDRKRTMRERVEPTLLKSPLAEFSDGRRMLEIFRALEPLLPDTWESPTLNACATARAGEAFLGMFAPDRYSYLEHWVRELETGCAGSAGPFPNRARCETLLRRGWWMAAFLAELGSLAGAFLSEGARQQNPSPSTIRAFATHLTLDSEPSENRKRFRAWTALLPSPSDRRKNTLELFDDSWEKVVGSKSSEFSAGFDVNEGDRLHFDTLGSLLALGALTNDEWHLGHPEADYPAKEVRDALAFQLTGHLVERHHVVEQGAWYPALLALCRGLSLYGGACPWEPFPPSVEFRNAAPNTRNEILLESHGAVLAFDFRYVTPDGCSDEEEEFNRKADLVELYRDQRLFHVRRLFERITVRSPRFPVARIAWHAGLAYASVFEFAPASVSVSDAPSDASSSPVVLPSIRSPENAPDVRTARLLELQTAMARGNWTAALSTLETVEPALLTSRMGELLALLPIPGPIPEQDPAPWYGVVELSLSLLPFAEDEHRHRLLKAAEQILKERFTPTVVPVLERLRVVYRSLDGATRHAFISAASEYLSAKNLDPNVALALLEFIPVFFDALGQDAMKRWATIARKHAGLKPQRTGKIADWVSNRLRELSHY